MLLEGVKTGHIFKRAAQNDQHFGWGKTQTSSRGPKKAKIQYGVKPDIFKNYTRGSGQQKEGGNKRSGGQDKGGERATGGEGQQQGEGATTEEGKKRSVPEEGARKWECGGEG